MNRKRPAMSAGIAIVLAAVPIAGAKADSAYVAFPPFWPLITIGAIIGTAAAAAVPPCCYYGPRSCYCVPAPPASYYPPPGYSAPGYYQPGYYPGR